MKTKVLLVAAAVDNTAVFFNVLIHGAHAVHVCRVKMKYAAAIKDLLANKAIVDGDRTFLESRGQGGGKRT